MAYLPNLFFLFLLIVSLYVFFRNLKKIKRNIGLGKDVNRNNNSNARLKNMLRVAFGQSKMGSRPVAAVLHFIVYVGFILINIELLEIILDGILGRHRIFAPFLGVIYDYLISIFEILAFLVLIAVFFFWTRRNVVRLKRFFSPETVGWPTLDANNILYFEVVLMFLFLFMNATDMLLQDANVGSYVKTGIFPISQFLKPLFIDLSIDNLILFERVFWWLHITGILIFLNYLYYSKHLHILLAFPNTYYANLESNGKFDVDSSIKDEVQLILNPGKEINGETTPPDKFGATDIFDLNWIQLMNAYSCTECGRCSNVCPANLTGKKLSPRAIMMKTRDRLEEVSKNLDKNNGNFINDNKQLLNDYISPEELWACTSCNACVEECPIEINPLSIIMDMRKYLTLEKSAAPAELNIMMNNIENNGAPWPFSKQDRLEWVEE